MSITLLTGSYASGYRCPDCRVLVGIHQTTFDEPCPKCGFNGTAELRCWRWELSRWRLVLGWPMIEWDYRDGDPKEDSW